MGDILMVLLPAGILVAVLWTLATALRPRDSGTSDAEKYQQDLARRSAEHYAEQVRVATALRAHSAVKREAPCGDITESAWIFLIPAAASAAQDPSRAATCG